MPILSRFNGITVLMHSERGEQHNKPHIHCRYGDKEMVMDFYGNIMQGSFPKNQLKQVREWILLHQKELFENWELLYNGEQPFKIPAL